MNRSSGRWLGILVLAVSFDSALADARDPRTARLVEAAPGATIRWEAGSPRWIAAVPGAALSAPRQETPEIAVRAFLREQRELFGLSEREIADLERTSSVRGPGGSTHLYFRQTVGGLEVRGGRLNVTVRADGAVLWVGSRVFGGLSPPVEPTLSRHDALRTVGLEAPRARLVVVPEGAGRLAWEVRGADDSGELRLVLVDARDGSRLGSASLTFHASARVLLATKPDPETEEFAPVEHQVVPIPDSTPASPQGWLASPGTSLAGNNASSHLFDPSEPGLSSPSGVYDYPFNTPQAALVNAWYWVNDAHDRFYALGFDEQAGNFQQNNFGRGGIGGDTVRVVERGSFASFTATVDGEAPTLTFSWKTGCRHCADHDGNRSNGGDRAIGFMREIIVHEYTHGVAVRRVGGPADDTCLNSGQSLSMAESWSDVLAGSFFEEPRVGEYFHEGGGWLRDPRHDLVYEGYYDLLYVWAGALWDLRDSMIALVPQSGRDDFERLVVEAMAVTPCHPSMLDGRDALLAADTLLFSAVHHGMIWNAFATRGMGEGASSMGADDTFPVLDFTTPAPFACAPPPAPSGLAASTSASDTIALTWSGAGASAFEIWRDDLDNAADAPVRVAVTNNSSNFADTSVQGGKSYRYHVVALGTGGVTCRSGPSTTTDGTATGTCDAVYPIFVPNLTVADAGNPSCGVTLSWQPAQPACPGSSVPIVYNVYRSLEHTGVPSWGPEAGTPGFDPSDRLLVARTNGTSIVDVPPAKVDVAYNWLYFDSASYYLVLAQHGTLDDSPDHRDRGSAQVLQWSPAVPALGRTLAQSWDFDSGPQGWALTYGSEYPEHAWALTDPSPTYWGGVLLAPDEPAGGTGQAWVTGDASGGPSTATSHDCRLTGLSSPVFDGTNGATLLSFDYWAHPTPRRELESSLFIQALNGIGGSANAVDMGMKTTQRFLGPGRYGWQRGAIDLSRLVAPSASMQVSLYSYRCIDLGEFGIDNVRLERGTVCPRSRLEIETVHVDDGASGNGVLEPGETARLAVELRNEGSAAASTPSGFVSPGTPGAVVLDAHSSFGDIAPGATGLPSGDGFLVSMPPAPDCLGSTTFEMRFTDATGEIAMVAWSVQNDPDADAVCPALDNCDQVANRNQVDQDSDSVGDACDNCDLTANPDQSNGDTDLFGDACDNCTLVNNYDQANADGDAVGDACDCAPNDATLERIPLPITGDRFTSKTRLAWDANLDATSYGVHVGSIGTGDAFSYAHVCEEGLSTAIPETNDPQQPGPGELRYYLVAGSNGCGAGDLGTDSAGNPRPFFPCGGGE